MSCSHLLCGGCRSRKSFCLVLLGSKTSGATFAGALLFTPSVCYAATVSRGRDRAAPLPTHLLRICAGTLKRHGQCAVSKFASGQSHTVALPRKHLLTPNPTPKKHFVFFWGPRGGRQGSVALRRRGGKGKAEPRSRTPSVTMSGLTTPPSCLRQSTSPYTGEAKIRNLTNRGSTCSPSAREARGGRSFLLQGSRKDFAQQKICGKRRRKPSGQAARNAAADLRALRRRGGKGKSAA